MNDSRIFLAQTDTTAGLLSHDERALNRAKGRSEAQKCLICVASLARAGDFVRFAAAFRPLVRRAKKTTFLQRGRAVRVCKDARHSAFLEAFLGGWAFSTSANPHGAGFDWAWARGVADVVEGENCAADASGGKSPADNVVADVVVNKNHATQKNANPALKTATNGAKNPANTRAANGEKMANFTEKTTKNNAKTATNLVKNTTNEIIFTAAQSSTILKISRTKIRKIR